MRGSRASLPALRCREHERTESVGSKSYGRPSPHSVIWLPSVNFLVDSLHLQLLLVAPGEEMDEAFGFREN